MAVAYAEIDHSLAEVLRHDAAYEDVTILGAWMRVTRTHVEYWLLTAPLSRAQELRLYALEAVIRERYPQVNPELHVIHAGMFADEHPFAPPAGSVPVPLPSRA